MSPSSVRKVVGRTVAIAAMLSLTLAGATGLDAQQPAGRIVGRVIDAQSGQGLPYAGIQVVGTTLGAQSQVEGRFSIPGIPAGTVSIQVRLIGYAPKTITGVVVPANGAIEQNVTLDAATVQLQAQIVTASAERGTVSQALDLQRNALAIVSSVSSEQIARSPDSDAAQAVQRVSGVTVQDGKYVFVRGLGERYTTTSLNGARLPSPEPERKVIPLDLFPSNLLQTITTSKTFTPDQPGDFSGALVDIRTREFPARRQFTYGMTTGYNDAATGRKVLASPTAGREWLALGGTQRSLHPLVREASTRFGDLPQSELNRVAGTFRNAWTPLERTGAPNTSFSASVGGSDPLFGQRFGYLLSGTFSNSQEVRRGEVRANAQPGDGGVAEVSDRFAGETGRTSVLWGGLANLSTTVGAHSRLALNGTYNRTADNEARTERGFSENLATDLEIMRLRYVERSVHSAQLAGEHTLGARHDASWALTASGVSRQEPDRSDFVYNLGDEMTGSPNGGWFATSNEGAVRTFGRLDESNLEGSAAYKFTLGSAGRQHSIKVGGLFRSTDREADNQSYSIRGLGVDSELRGRSAENIIATLTQHDAQGLRLTSLSQGGSYDATDRLTAGYAMADVVLSPRFRLIGGARVERSDVTVNAQPTFGEGVTSRPSYTDVLPSAALNVSLGSSQSVRVSVSQTLSRPEYREIAPIGYYDVLGGDIVIGNENLRRATIQNADVRWEWYPDAGEIMSVALFAKRFEDPIERIYLATSGTRYISFANAQQAENYGIELEARKRLDVIAGFLAPFTAFTNVTLMQSDITIGGGEASRTNDRRAMVGQAPYVINAGTTYATESGATNATLLYNVVGRRIHSAAEAPLPDVYEESRHVLDFSLRFPVWRAVSGRFDARNILDAPYELRQGAVVREAYRAGRVLQMGLTWRP